MEKSPDKRPDEKGVATASDESVRDARSVLQRLEPIARGAAHITDKVKAIGIVFSLAGVALWLLLFVVGGDWGVVRITSGVVAAVLFAIPGASWLLLSSGFARIARLPLDLGKLAGETHDRAVADVKEVQLEGGFVRRSFRLLKAAAKLRSAGLEGHTLIIQSAALARIVNPFTAAFAAATFAGGVVLLVGVVVAALVRGVI